jgi:hypothetical protein
MIMELHVFVGFELLRSLVFSAYNISWPVTYYFMLQVRLFPVVVFLLLFCS